jgi:hypothetical protein
MDETRIELLAVLAGRLRHFIDTLEPTLQTFTPTRPLANAYLEALLGLARATAECAEHDLALHCEAHTLLQNLRAEVDAIKAGLGLVAAPARPHLTVAWDQDMPDAD